MTYYDVWFVDGDTNKKTGNEAGGGRYVDIKIFIGGDDQDEQD